MHQILEGKDVKIKMKKNILYTYKNKDGIMHLIFVKNKMLQDSKMTHKNAINIKTITKIFIT